MKNRVARDLTNSNSELAGALQDFTIDGVDLIDALVEHTRAMNRLADALEAK